MKFQAPANRNNPPKTNNGRRRNLFVCLLLAGITLAIYWPARHYDLIYFDDPLFIGERPEINAGLNWHSLVWASTALVAANWHPVTSLSFVVTHAFWGANPGAEHLVNAVFHALNAVLLFLVLDRMTKAPGRSAVVAAIFAWHPLRVESVAWIAERKDVLCGFFFLLTLLAYARYARKSAVRSPQSAVENQTPGPRPLTSGYYWLALVFFVLGFMSKPMAVTLPFALLLLDVWPLKRVTGGLPSPSFGTAGKWPVASNPAHKSPVTPDPQPLGAAKRSEDGSSLNQLILEKWPFFALSAICCALTYEVQKNLAAVVSFDRLGLGDRINNAIFSYVSYLGKFFWPAKLAAIYPYAKSLDVTEVWLAGLLLLAVSALCLCQISRRPYLAVGWFWYLGTMLPVIGLVQVGSQGMADRYTYIPLIGPAISLVWLVSGKWNSGILPKALLSTAATVILAAGIILTSRQLQFWRNTIALFEHNVAVTPENAPAYFTLGVGLEHAGDTNRAMICYRAAVAIFPGDAGAHGNLGSLLSRQGRFAAAEEEYNILLALNPNDSAAHLCLANVAGHLGRTDEVVFHLNEVLRLNPDSVDAMNNLAWLLATCPDANVRDGTRAVQLAEHACELTGYKKTMYVGTLAAAYAEAGRFAEAMATAQKACALASQSGEQDLLQKNRELLELYRAHKPYHGMR